MQINEKHWKTMNKNETNWKTMKNNEKLWKHENMQKTMENKNNGKMKNQWEALKNNGKWKTNKIINENY